MLSLLTLPTSEAAKRRGLKMRVACRVGTAQRDKRSLLAVGKTCPTLGGGPEPPSRLRAGDPLARSCEAARKTGSPDKSGLEVTRPGASE